MTDLVHAANELFKKMEQSYLYVLEKTSDINKLCKEHISEEHHLKLFSDEIRSRLEVFEALETLSLKMNSPNIDVESPFFIELLKKLDRCIEYLENNVSRHYHVCKIHI